MILTTDEAASELGVEPATVRSMVNRGEIAPLRRGARPLLFRFTDVVEAGARRLTNAQHDTLDRLAQRLACADETDVQR